MEEPEVIERILAHRRGAEAQTCKCFDENMR
jgi:hypothetical protein